MPLLASAARLAALLLAAGSLPALAQSADGQRLFQARCGTCHSLEAGANRLGPTLAGVVGRAAGAVEGARYSSALRASGLVWDAETLDRYLANPRQLVPGTTMTVALPNAAQREAIVAYLMETGR